MNRYELAQAIAIDRVEYENDTLAQGYGPGAFQPLDLFCIAMVKKMARAGRRIAGVSCRQTDYGFTYTLDVDWKRLAKRVERQLPMWRETIARVAAEDALAASPVVSLDSRRGRRAPDGMTAGGGR